MTRLLIEVEVDEKGAIKNLGGVSRGVSNVGKTSKATTKDTKLLSGSFLKMAGILGGAAGVIALMKGMFSASLRLNKGLSEIATLTGGLSKNELKDMADELRQVSINSGQALDKLTKARYDIVSAGFSKAADSAAVMSAAADLATAGVADVSETADLLTTAINSWSLSAGDAAEINDKLFTIVKLGKTTIGELAQSLGPVAAIAGQVGVSLDEVGAATAVLTAGGQDTRRALTSLQAVMTSLASPTDTMAALIQRLGFESGLALIQEKGLAESLKLVQEEAKNSNIPITKVFSSVEALRAVLPLVGTAADDFTSALKDMKDEGTEPTADALAVMADDADFQLGRMKAAFVVLGTEISGPFTGTIARLAKGFADLFSPDKTTTRINNLKIQIAELQEELSKSTGEGGFLETVADIFLFRAGAPSETRLGLLIDQLHLLEIQQIANAAAAKENANAQEDLGDAFGDEVEVLDIVTESWEDLEKAEKAAAKEFAKDAKDFVKFTDEMVKAEEDRKQSILDTASSVANAADDEKEAARGAILAEIARAVTTQFRKILTVIPFPFNIPAAAAGAALLKKTIDSAIPKFQHGGVADGLSLVGEQGPELRELPAGTIVTPAAETETRLNQENQGGDYYDMRGALFAEDANTVISKMVESSVDAGRSNIQLGRDNA